MYKTDIVIETGIWNEAFVIINVRVISTSDFLSWFNPDETC